MAINKEKKTEILATLAEMLKDAQSLVFVKFKGVKVNDQNAMRKSLREQGVGYYVAKKTLVKRALLDAKIEGTLPELEGEMAVAYSTDAVAPAKGIAEFVKKFKDVLGVAGGMLEGRYLAIAEVEALAKIPSREQLLGKLVNVMNAPIQGFVRTLNEVPGSFVRVLDGVSKTKN
ncbi:MAG: 50S ribosomal protein L10 [Candidatus Paceibacterota bacterium]|jgi:large subunit ribosomal protein L10